MLNLIINRAHFKFDGKFYEMDGLPMGCSLSPFLSDLFLHKLESLIHHSNFSNLLIHWSRYVDDICIIWAGSQIQLHEFVDYINNLHPRIKFTLEMEKNNQLNYLDLTLTRLDRNISISVFHKPTSKNIIIPYTSKHHLGHKLAAFYAFFNRLHNLPLNQTAFEKERIHIFDLGYEYGYPNDIIDEVYRKVKIRKLTATAYNQQSLRTENNKKYVSVSFMDNPGLLHKIKNTYRKHKMELTYKNYNMANYLTNTHIDKLDILQQSGVYQLKCKNCEAIYI